jgi:regulator of replication initiation timing
VRGVKQETSKLMEELEKLSNDNDKLRNKMQQMDSTNRQLTQEVMGNYFTTHVHIDVY